MTQQRQCRRLSAGAKLSDREDEDRDYRDDKDVRLWLFKKYI